MCEFLYDVKWYVGDEMNEECFNIMKVFFIFEVYLGVDIRIKINVDFVCFKLFLVFVGVDEVLFSFEFLCIYLDRELEWLVGFLKVKYLERFIFYKWRVFNCLYEIILEVWDRMMLFILKEFL